MKSRKFISLLAQNLGESDSIAPCQSRARGLTDLTDPSAIDMVNIRTQSQIKKQLNEQPSFSRDSKGPLEDLSSDSESQSSDLDEAINNVGLSLAGSSPKAAKFKSRFDRCSDPEEIALRRVQSHCGATASLTLKRRDTSPFHRFPHLTGK